MSSISLPKAKSQDESQLEWGRVTLASISHAVITADIHGLVTFMNPVAESLTGWTQGQATGKSLQSVFNVIDQETRAPIEMPSIHRSSEGVIGLANHTLLLARDGVERPIDPSAAPIRNTDGTMTGIVIVFRDVTGRYREEHALHVALEYAEDIIANLREPFLVLDKHLRVQMANAAFYGTFFVEPETVKHSFLYTLSESAWDIPQLRASLQGLLLHNSPLRNFEVEHCFPSIGKRSMMLNASRLASKHRTSELILLAIEDVTGRRRADLEVKASESRYRRLFETARDGILILDAETLRIIDANPFMTELLKYSREEFLGKELWEFGFFGDKEASQAVYQELQTHGYIRYDHLPLKTKRGETAEVEFISNVYEVVDYRTVAQCNIRDISERSRLERKLQEKTEALAEQHRRKDEFLAMLSHELRNPLGPIVNAVHLLQLRKDTDSLQQRALAIIKRQVSQLTHLIDELMEVSRITSGRVHLRNDRIDLNLVVDHAVGTVRPLIEERRHQLNVSVPAESVWINADAARMEQVIVNLLSNAAKYTDTGGRISITLNEEQDECVLRIKDNGIGIAPELLPRIFELFTQADRSLDRSRGGLGIGLAIVHRLTAMHRGSVEVTSTVGEGSEFSMRLPLMRELVEKSALLPERTAQIDSIVPSLRVLIADDNIDEVASLEMVMQAMGHEVKTARDGPTTLKLAEEFLPHVVLLDIGLPEMDGYETAKRLRESAQLHDPVLVAITGYGHEADRQNSQRAGFDHHLVKPASIERLQEILAAIPNNQCRLTIAPSSEPLTV